MQDRSEVTSIVTASGLKLLIAAVADGAAAHIPLLLGTNRDEYKLWSPTDPKAASLDDAALRRRMQRLLPGHDARGAAWADRVIEVYRTARAGRRPVLASELWFAIETDRLLRDPLLHLAGRHASHQPDTWVYLFTWESPAMEGRLGSCHALEIPFVFGTFDHPAVRTLTGTGVEAARLSRIVQDAWLAFARTGCPVHADLPDWRPYEPPRRSTQLLGRECPVVDAPDEAERRFWDELRLARQTG